MSSVAIIEPRQKSVLLDMSDRYGMEPVAFEATLRATVVPKDCSAGQFAAFLLIAKEYRLNPILKEIYAFPAKGGGIQPIVGVDGWANLINSHPAFDGMSFEDNLGESGELISITCVMHRKDRTRAITATEYMSECKRPTEPWTKWPRRMLRHKAMIQAARYAFSFAGIIDPDEAERFAGDLAREVVPRPSLAERLSGPAPAGAGFSIDHVQAETEVQREAADTDSPPPPASMASAREPESSGSEGAQDRCESAPSPNSPPIPTAADTPASVNNPTPALADAGNLSPSDQPAPSDGAAGGDGAGIASPSSSVPYLSPDWQDTYLRAMAMVNDRPKSLPTRHNEALQLIGGKPNEEEKEWMKAVYRLTERRLKGEITKDECDAAIREIA